MDSLLICLTAPKSLNISIISSWNTLQPFSSALFVDNHLAWDIDDATRLFRWIFLP